MNWPYPRSSRTAAAARSRRRTRWRDPLGASMGFKGVEFDVMLAGVGTRWSSTIGNRGPAPRTATARFLKMTFAELAVLRINEKKKFPVMKRR
jgi:hypothetical protein